MRRITRQNRLYRLLSIPVTALAVALAHFTNTPNPMMILIIPVVFFSFIEGYASGALSGLVAVLYSLYFFSNKGQPFTYNAENLQKVFTIVLAVTVIVALVGRLKKREFRAAEVSRRHVDNFLTILNGMTVQLLVTDPDTGEVLYANQRMNDGYSIDYDPMGKPCWEVYHGRKARCPFCKVPSLALNPSAPIEWEYRNDRTGRWYHNRESIIEWTDGRRVHLQQGVDITENKENARMLLEAKEMAEGASRQKSDFLSHMSHEIRTPMNAIVGMSSIAMQTDDVGRIHECLGRVGDASTHLLGVINDVLDMSKIEAGKFELSDSDFVLEHMLQRVASVNAYRFEQKQQHFSITVDPSVPTAIVADQQRLAQVVTNLLSNATKFTPNGGNIRLRVEHLADEGEHVRLRMEVSDDGIGMTDEQQGRLFASFQQADSSISRRFGGTGLGLAISKSIVEKMGGSIWVNSAPGRGSTFLFTIRVHRGAATRTSNLSPNIDWARVRLLAVDDAPEVCEYFRTVTAQLGIACDTAANGDEALALLRERPYQIAFVDWDMPGVDGISLARRIRAEHDGQTVVIMISAADWQDIEAPAKAAGVTHYIAKPLLPSPIIDCINICFGEQTVHLDPAEQRHAPESNTDIFMGRRLLLVEDIEINRDIVKAMLADTGIEIVEAINGQEGVSLYAHQPGAFDVIFMDMHMPVMDGLTATREIRRLPSAEAAAVPIIAMTANVFREDIDQCLEAGMNDHLGKPVDPAEIVETLKRHVPVR